ncbi:unnamed protein product [Pieris macdunnoughi]|uniref:Uncharacterized protein n=1 Tax=Pieris macdunnoughi TaxID=345717 RepID=A0A821NRA1_9NEOP|nr:unnamed protein product [Pieris macdunnoughi]
MQHLKGASRELYGYNVGTRTHREQKINQWGRGDPSTLDIVDKTSSSINMHHQFIGSELDRDGRASAVWTTHDAFGESWFGRPPSRIPMQGMPAGAMSAI